MKQCLSLTEAISCGAFVLKSDPFIGFLFQRHCSSALVLQKQSVNGEYCAKTLKGALQNAFQHKDMCFCSNIGFYFKPVHGYVLHKSQC
jgi:hypothetical protein